jgi:hypothetical protein
MDSVRETKRRRLIKMASVKLIPEDEATGKVKAPCEEMKTRLGTDFVPNFYKKAVGRDTRSARDRLGSSSRTRTEDVSPPYHAEAPISPALGEAAACSPMRQSAEERR